MSTYTAVGTCSLCGGRVSVPSFWMSIVPPVPTCESCGATAALHGPVMPMQPAPTRKTWNTTTLSIDFGDEPGGSHHE